MQRSIPLHSTFYPALVLFLYFVHFYLNCEHMHYAVLVCHKYRNSQDSKSADTELTSGAHCTARNETECHALTLTTRELVAS